MIRARSQNRTGGSRVATWTTLGIVLSALFVLAPSAFADNERGTVVIRAAQEQSCSRCDVQARFVESLKDFNAAIEAVALSRGVGVWYTTSSDQEVKPLQKAVYSAVKDIHDINAHPEQAHLCQFCTADFPVYSELEHEILDTKRGVFLLITSEDPGATVAVQKMFRVYIPQRAEQQMQYQFRLQQTQDQANREP